MKVSLVYAYSNMVKSYYKQPEDLFIIQEYAKQLSFMAPNF